MQRAPVVLRGADSIVYDHVGIHIRQYHSSYFMFIPGTSNMLHSLLLDPNVNVIQCVHTSDHWHGHTGLPSRGIRWQGRESVRDRRPKQNLWQKRAWLRILLAWDMPSSASNFSSNFALIIQANQADEENLIIFSLSSLAEILTFVQEVSRANKEHWHLVQVFILLDAAWECPGRSAQISEARAKITALFGHHITQQMCNKKHTN